MGIFFPDDTKRFMPGRKMGFEFYKEVLEGNYKEFFIVGFINLIFLLPYIAGMAYAVLSSSMLIAFASGIIGGMICGPALSCMYDLILRRLRDDKADWWVCFKRSMKQNWKASLLPSIVEHVFLSFLIFSGALMYWAKAPISYGTLALLALASVFMTLILLLWWSQTVLFSQRPSIQIKNAVLFILYYPWRSLLTALLVLVWWLVFFLFLPWTAFLVPVLSIWYILFVALFLIYRRMDDEFEIEDQIRKKYPGVLPKIYEDEEENDEEEETE